MKVTATIPHDFDVAVIRVSAKVRYWEDSFVNGDEDTDGTLIPFRRGDLWEPIIDLETGRVMGWPEGTLAKVNYKVCDEGTYHLLDQNGAVVATREGYVPDMLAVGDHGYGDYIILTIRADGLIGGWEPPVINAAHWKWTA